MKRGLNSLLAGMLMLTPFGSMHYQKTDLIAGHPFGKHKMKEVDVIGGFRLNVEPLVYAIEQFKKYNHVDINKMYEKEDRYPLKFTVMNIDTRNYLELSFKFD